MTRRRKPTPRHHLHIRVPEHAREPAPRPVRESHDVGGIHIKGEQLEKVRDGFYIGVPDNTYTNGSE